MSIPTRVGELIANTSSRLNSLMRPAFQRIARLLPKRPPSSYSASNRHIQYHAYSKSRRRRAQLNRLNRLAMVLLLLTTMVLPFINLEVAEAANLELAPNSDVTAGWLESTGTTAYTLVDEPSGSPVTTDYISTGTAGSGGEIAEFGLADASNVASVSNIKVYIYAYSATNANGGNLDTVSIDLRIGGSLLGSPVTVTPAYSAGGTHAWYNASFNGTWTQAQLNGVQAYITRNVVGTTNPVSGRDDDIRIATVYANVTYTELLVITYDQSGYRWFENDDSTDVANPLAALNTAATAPNEGVPFRLRMNLHVNNLQAEVGAAIFKLQYAQRGVDNVCDTSFTNETYGDLSPTSGAIRFYNNTTVTDGQALATNANDPTHGADDLVRQTYEEANNFTIANAIPAGDDGMWDFALLDAGAPASTTYCFRAVKSTSAVLSSYAVIPQITTSSSTISQASFRAYENGGVVGAESFAKAWGGIDVDYAHSTVQTTDGGYVVTGYTMSYGAGSADILLNKYDSAGGLTWSRSWGGTGDDRGRSVIQTNDGGYVVAGYTNSFAGGYNALLNRYDPEGNLVWSRLWGASGADTGYFVIQTTDGGYAITGYTMSYGAGGADVFFAKFDSSGTLSWSRTWGGTADDFSYSIAQTSDGGYIIVGYTMSYGDIVNGDAMIIKYSSTGQLQWSRTWGGSADERANSIVQASDGGYLMTGYTGSYGAGGDDMFIAKFDSSGNQSWSRTWGGAASDYGESVKLTPDGGFIVAGYTTTYGSGSGDAFLAKFSNDSTLDWSRTWGGTSTDYGYAVAATIDNGYILAGRTDSYGAGGGDILLVKYELNGEVFGCSSTICRSPTAVVGVDGVGYTSNVDVDGIDYTSATDSPTTTTSSPTATVNSPTATDTTIVNPPATSIHVTSGLGLLGKSMVFVNGGGYAVASDVSDGNQSNLMISRYDSVGSRTMSKTWSDIYQVGPGWSQESAHAVAQTSDGGFIASGQVLYEEQTGYNRMFIVKFDASGNISWSRYVRPELTGRDFYSKGVVQAADGGYLVTGGTTSYSAGGNDMFLIKLNSSGALSWSRTWGGAGSDTGNSLVQTTDGGCLVTGSTSSYGDNGDMFLAKYASDGALSWSRTWGGAGSDTGNSLIQTIDGGYAVTGNTGSYGAGSNDMFLAKYTSDGTLSWSRTWGGIGSDVGNALAQAADNGYIVTGSTYSYGAGSSDMFLAKYTSDGTFSWSRTWGGIGSDLGYAVSEASDHNYSVIGSTTSFGVDYNNSFIAKFDRYGDARGCSASYCGSPAASMSQPAPTTTGPTPTPGEPSPTNGTISPTSTMPPTSSVTQVVAPSGIVYLQNGAPLSATDNRAELVEIDMSFRLRIGLQASGRKYDSTGTFKLQSGVYTGTCDPSTTSYTDVSSATSPIAFYDNGFATTGDKVHPDATNPVVSGTRETMQTYVETNPFSNPRHIGLDDTGIWDFALKADGAKIGRTYCFRIVESGNSLNGGYSQYAEVYIPPTMGNVMRHGKFFNTRGVAQPFAWGR